MLKLVLLLNIVLRFLGSTLSYFPLLLLLRLTTHSPSLRKASPSNPRPTFQTARKMMSRCCRFAKRLSKKTVVYYWNGSRTAYKWRQVNLVFWPSLALCLMYLCPKITHPLPHFCLWPKIEGYKLLIHKTMKRLWKDMWLTSEIYNHIFFFPLF